MYRYICFVFLASFISCNLEAAVLSSSEKGILFGSLGFGAMTLDAYYEHCYSNNIRTDNHLKGINKLLTNKWRKSYSEVIIKLEKDSGRNHRQEAHTLIKTVIKETGGCKTLGMEEWFNKFRIIHEKNLKVFHSSQ